MAPITLPPVSAGVGPLQDGLDALSSSRPSRPDAASEGSFGDALGRALAGVEKLQTSADASAEQVALGGGNLHETALALEKADVAMRVAVKVRNKLVDAYQEIMRMNV